MDPDQALREIREMFSQHYQGNPVDLDRLAELWEGLDNHMIRAGFPPSAWPRC